MKQILTKLLKVQSQIKSVAYDTKVSTGGGFSYSATSHDAVVNAIRPKLIAEKIFVIPTIIDCNVEKVEKGYSSWCQVALKIVDADSGEFIETSGFGQGVDPQDKGPGKAYSYAYKYGILKAFMLETGENDEVRQEERAGASLTTPPPASNSAIANNATAQPNNWTTYKMELKKYEGKTAAQIGRVELSDYITYVQKLIEKGEYKGDKNKVAKMVMAYQATYGTLEDQQKIPF